MLLEGSYMKLNNKIIFLGFLFMFLYIYAAFVYIEYVETRQIHEKYRETVQKIHYEVNTLIAEKQEAILLISLSLSENDKIKKLLKSHTYSDLHLNTFSQKLKEYSSLESTWFQVLSSDGKSLYRSWTSVHGDTLLDVRKDIEKILHKPEVFSSISVGKFDMTFKSIVPIYQEKHFLGLVETIAKFNSISKKMRASGFNNILLVESKYQQQLSRVEKTRFLQGYYIATQNIDRSVLEQLRHNLQKYLHIQGYIVENNQLFTRVQIKDVNGEGMANFIFSLPIESIDISEIKNQMITLISIFVLLFVVIAVVFYYIYFVNYKQFLLEQKELLQEHVNKKTEELQTKSEALKYQAEHDALTNLPNRMLVMNRLKKFLKDAQEDKSQIFVLFLDLDRFKEINDTYGHEVGDKLLKEVTKRLQMSLRKKDTIARLGGDEFILLFNDLDEEGVLKVIEKIIQSMEREFTIDGIELYTTFSIGVSRYPEDGKSCDDLLRNADTAMYKAKENGKNNYYFYNAQMTQAAFERMQLDKELRKALENREFQAYFQPKIDAKRNKIIGLEALVRWSHPTKGLIYPDSFIPFAEETGFIDKIDNFMMRTTMEQVLAWQKKGIECGKVSINLSSRQLTSKTYITELKEVIESVGFSTESLEIEITETHIMLDPEYAMEVLSEIRKLGISISIDDFGTGYSSLAYLKKLPITKLKIDRSFVMDLPEDKDDVAIVRTIISLAKNLDLDIIAEGVESREQLQCLLDEGCEAIQGYYFSKPLSKELCEEFLVNFETS